MDISARGCDGGRLDVGPDRGLVLVQPCHATMRHFRKSLVSSLFCIVADAEPFWAYLSFCALDLDPRTRSGVRDTAALVAAGVPTRAEMAPVRFRS
jgi:hypothetical protein